MELNWVKHSVISTTGGESIFQITKTELYVPVVTLNTEKNNTLTRLLSEGFKRSVIWNEYKSKIETVNTNNGITGVKRTTLDPSFQGVRRLLVMDFDNPSVKRNFTKDIN